MSGAEQKYLTNEERKALSKVKYEGKVFPTKRFGDCVVVEYETAKKVKVKFLRTGYVTEVSSNHLVLGEIQDHTQPTHFGIGILDEKGLKSKPYVAWYNMLKRCYSEASLKKSPTYHGCEVSDDFKYYSKFKEWYLKQVGHDQDGWHLDKDILVKGNKVYSEETCCLVPQEINTVLLKREAKRGKDPIGVWYDKKLNKFQSYVRIDNARQYLGVYETKEQAFYVYKQAKENYIKKIAHKYKEEVDVKVYEALLNYKVEITD